MERPLDEKSARAAALAACDAVTCDDVRVVLTADDSGFTRYAANEVTTSGVVRDCEVHVTCAVGARHATVSLHGRAPSLVAEAARRALALAKLAPEDPEFVPDVGATVIAPIDSAWSDAGAATTPEDRAGHVAAAIAEAKRQRLIAAGFFQHNRQSFAVATRRGFFGLHHSTSAELSTTVRTPDGTGSGWGQTAGVRPTDLDPAAATATACDKAERSHAPQPLDPGAYPVVLEPAAVAELLDTLQYSGTLDARAADEGRSALSRPGGGARVGERLFGALTLHSDPRAPLLPAAPFDPEGMPRTPITWIDAGVVKRLRVSRFWAKHTGRPADAIHWTRSASGPSPAPLPELIKRIDRGLVVTRFWYIRMLEPQTLKVTGLTRDGVFLVEKGRVVRPVNNFRFNQSIIEMFADTEAYGVPVRVSDGSVVPAIYCKKFHMASRSDAV